MDGREIRQEVTGSEQLGDSGQLLLLSCRVEPSVKQQRTEDPLPEGAGLAGLGSYGSDDSP